MPELRFEIESDLPDPLVAGRGNVILVHGWCFHLERKIKKLELGFGDRRFPALEHSAPRPDLTGDLAGATGFWGLVEVRRVRAPERRPLTLEAELAGGGTARVEAGVVEVLPSIPVDWAQVAEAPEESPREQGMVAICMPTYEPKLDLLEAQVESLRAQEHPDWYCLMVDDHSRPETLEGIERIVAGDPRFLIRRHDRRLGFYRNVERALTYVSDAAVVMLCDQDDRWHPDKLRVMTQSLLDEYSLAYCDMRVIDDEGAELSPSYWEAVGRRNQWDDFDTLLVSNTITGAASIFRSSLLSVLLPFPEAPGPVFHDQWLGLIARASGQIRYIGEPLQDYVQHGENVTLGVELDWRSSPREVYANDVLQREILARVVEMRCGPWMDRHNRRAVARFAHADERRSGAGSIAALSRSKRRRETTGGLERKLAEALRWRRKSRNGDGGPLPIRDQYGKISGHGNE